MSEDMVMDDPNLQQLKDRVDSTRADILLQISYLRRDMETHLTDRFAHGWDHNKLIEGQKLTDDYFKWRDSINRWRWMTAGGLILLSTEIPVALTIFAYIFHLH